MAYDDTYALERVFRVLVEKGGGGGGGLRRLVVKLVCVESFRGRDGDRDVDTLSGFSRVDDGDVDEVLRDARIWAGRVEGGFGRGLEGWESGVDGIGGRMSGERCGSFLGRMRRLRSFKVVKRPLEGSRWAVEFEIAVLR